MSQIQMVSPLKAQVCNQRPKPVSIDSPKKVIHEKALFIVNPHLSSFVASYLILLSHTAYWLRHVGMVWRWHWIMTGHGCGHDWIIRLMHISHHDGLVRRHVLGGIFVDGVHVGKGRRFVDGGLARHNSAVDVDLPLLEHPVLEFIHRRLVATTHAAATFTLLATATTLVLGWVEVCATEVGGGVVVGTVCLASSASCGG
jgi:hypothetical protein